MKKFLHFLRGTCVIMLLSIFFPSLVKAQYNDGGPFSEIGITLGPSNFLGDLGGHLGKGTTFLKDNNFNLTKLSVGAHFSYYPKDWIGVRLAVNIGKFEGDDKVINPKGGGLEQARYNRGLNFQSKFFEAIVVGELYPTVFLEDDPSDVYHKLRPYGIAGIGVFHFNPQGLDLATGQWVNLQPLHLEGQGSAEYPDRKNYSLWQPNIPLGVGVKYWVSDNMSLGVEVLYRKTFTDYIDDVSTTYVGDAFYDTHLPAAQAALAKRMADKSNNGAGGLAGYGQAGDKRGTSQNKDAYYTFGIKLGIRLGSSDKFNNSTRCPVIRF